MNAVISSVVFFWI